MQPGDVLPNGAIVLMHKTTPMGSIVLCLWTERGMLQPFVTWELYPNGVTECGHYHANLEAAITDFKRRA